MNIRNRWEIFKFHIGFIWSILRYKPISDSDKIIDIYFTSVINDISRFNKNKLILSDKILITWRYLKWVLWNHKLFIKKNINIYKNILQGISNTSSYDLKILDKLSQVTIRGTLTDIEKDVLEKTNKIIKGKLCRQKE